jgi:curved DNA-binding protein
MYTALLGGDVIIQLSNGTKLKLKVKPGTQPGTKVRIPGKGADRGDGTYGDLVVMYQVTLPTQLNEHQKQLLMQMRMG